MEPEQNTTAATLARIEAKLDEVLQKLKWAPESTAEWYATLTQKDASPGGEDPSC